MNIVTTNMAFTLFLMSFLTDMQIACHPKSSFLAAADDAGDVKVCIFLKACFYGTKSLFLLD